MLKRLAVLITVGILVAGNAWAYYNPGNPTGFVNDFADLLTEGQETLLEQKLTAFEQETSNEIAVVTIPSLDGDYIENFAVKLFEDWGIGKKGKDNGILLLVARDDRKMRIEVGYGLEGALTDLQSYQIIDDYLKPAFRENDYYGGIDKATDLIISATKGEYEGLKPTKTNIKDFSGLLYFAFFALIWIASILGSSKSWWAGGVIGGIIGLIIGFLKGFVFIGVISMGILIPLGLLLDFWLSRSYHKHKSLGVMPWWFGGGKGGGFGGGFGGFGGGRSGGGGSSGDW